MGKVVSIAEAPIGDPITFPVGRSKHGEWLVVHRLACQGVDIRRKKEIS